VARPAPVQQEQPAATLLAPGPFEAPADPGAPDWLRRPLPCPSLGEHAVDLAVLGALDLPSSWSAALVSQPVDRWEPLLVEAGPPRADQPHARLLRAYAAYRRGAHARAKDLLSKATAGSPELVAAAGYIRGLIEHQRDDHAAAATYFQRAERSTSQLELDLAATYRLGLSQLAAGEGVLGLASLGEVIRLADHHGAALSPPLDDLGCAAESALVAHDSDVRTKLNLAAGLGDRLEVRLLDRLAASELERGTPDGDSNAWRVYGSLASRPGLGADERCDWLAAWMIAGGRRGRPSTLFLQDERWRRLVTTHQISCGQGLPESFGVAVQILHARYTGDVANARDLARAYALHLEMQPRSQRDRFESLHYGTTLRAAVAGDDAAEWLEVAGLAAEVVFSSPNPRHADEAHRLILVAYHNALALGADHVTQLDACDYVRATGRIAPSKIELGCGE
jgi:tetratricopeptide (TPR) repeat protein